MPIKISNLSYTYDKKAVFRKDALKNVSLEISDGEFWGIVGRTGSGKSTLVSHLNGLIPVQSGSIVIDDFDLSKKHDAKKLRAKVGMVFQYPEYQLFDETVAKDVAFGPRNLGLDEDEIANRVVDSLGLVGLNYHEIKDRSPFDLSGGQMRRVAIAGVIAMNPEVLILDEPTAGLDPRGKKEIMTLVENLRKSCKIVIMISHNMDEVATHCEKIAVMYDGELQGVFTPGELFGDEQKIRSFGLEMPSVTTLAGALSDAGISVDRSLVNEDELVEAILKSVSEVKP